MAELENSRRQRRNLPSVVCAPPISLAPVPMLAICRGSVRNAARASRVLHDHSIARDTHLAEAADLCIMTLCSNYVVCKPVFQAPKPAPSNRVCSSMLLRIVFPRRENPALTRLKAAAHQSDGGRVWDGATGGCFGRRKSLRLLDRSSSTPLLVTHPSSIALLRLGTSISSPGSHQMASERMCVCVSYPLHVTHDTVMICPRHRGAG